MCRVLIADSSSSDLNRMSDVLQRAYHARMDIRSASNGEEALRLTNAFQPQVMVLDVTLSGMGGLKVASLLREHNETLCQYMAFVFTSPAYDYACLKETIRYQTLDFLIKPFDAERLVDVLSTQMEAGESAPPPLRSEKIHASVSRTRSFLNAHIDRFFTVKELAERVEISPNYLSHLFVKDMGITLAFYQNSIKLERAKHLLVQCPQMKIYEIAYQLGYEDDKYFSRLFKRYCRISPGCYRSSFACDPAQEERQSRKKESLVR